MKIGLLIQTCNACPSQWEFRSDHDISVYVRYRWGRLEVCVGPPGGTIKEAVLGFKILSEQIGGPFDGVLDWAEVEKRIKDIELDPEQVKSGCDVITATRQMLKEESENDSEANQSS